MITVKLVRFAAFMAAFGLSACGGGGGGDAGSSAGAGGGASGGAPNPPAALPPAFGGFDFSLQAGDFWEYRWDFNKRTGGAGISTKTTTDKGRFWVVLGAPRTISGITAYEVEIYGKSQTPDGRFAPRWKYLALDENKVLGSLDGSTLTTVFDAQAGRWPGGGFFTEFGASQLVVAKSATLSNSYISTAAVSAGRSISKSQCEHFPGIGTICGDDTSQTLIENDYFKPGVGPVGHYYKNSFSSCGGGFCSFSDREHHLGMTASSRVGDSLPFQAEPATLHNGPSSAVARGTSVTNGDIHESDGGFSTSVVINGQNVPVVIEDWYRITVGSPIDVTVTLSFENSAPADIDLYVFNSSLLLQGMSVADNIATGNSNESVRLTLVPGVYYVTVDAFDTPGGRAAYTLQIE